MKKQFFALLLIFLFSACAATKNATTQEPNRLFKLFSKNKKKPEITSLKTDTCFEKTGKMLKAAKEIPKRDAPPPPAFLSATPQPPTENIDIGKELANVDSLTKSLRVQVKADSQKVKHLAISKPVYDNVKRAIENGNKLTSPEVINAAKINTLKFKNQADEIEDKNDWHTMAIPIIGFCGLISFLILILLAYKRGYIEGTKKQKYEAIHANL